MYQTASRRLWSRGAHSFEPHRSRGPRSPVSCAATAVAALTWACGGRTLERVERAGAGKRARIHPPARAKSEVLNSTPALAAAVRALSIRHMGLCNVTSACVPRCWSCGGQPARAKPKGRAREAFWLFSSGFLLVKFDLVCMDLG